MQYFVEKKTFLTQADWDSISCSDPLPSWLSPYMSALPCDPDTKLKYVYQPLNASCQPCLEGSSVCTGFRLLATLKNSEDKAIISSGCDPVQGCGVTGPNGEQPNFGVSSGCTIVATPFPISPTSILSPTPTFVLSVTPTISGPTLTPTITPSITLTITPSPTTSNPSPTLTSGPTPTLAVTPIPGFIPNPAFDEVRVSDLMKMTLALEKYNFLFGQYPTCGENWSTVSDCLTNPLINLLFQSVVPIDPENGDPYIYIAYSTLQNGTFDGFCLGAHLGDPASRAGEINCSITAPLPIYEYRIKERGEIIYRPVPSGLTQLEKNTRDAQRISDISYFTSRMEQYKLDFGHYPNCWPDALTWASTGSGSFFCSGQMVAYGTDFNFDPGGTYSYNIVQWDPDANGFFRQYCFATYMDTNSNTNCSLACPINNYNEYYCYFTKNP